MLLYSGIFILGALFGYAAGKIDWFVDGMHDPSEREPNTESQIDDTTTPLSRYRDVTECAWPYCVCNGLDCNAKARREAVAGKEAA